MASSLTSTPRLLPLVLACAGIACATNANPPGDPPQLGVPASQEDVARVFWSIFPDGQNLPPGKGTAARGRTLFQTHCQVCHGPEGVGKPADRLVGGRGTLTAELPLKTIGSYWPYATTLFNYVRRAMPYTAPMSLSNDDYYSLTAYLLQLNQIIDRDQTIDAKTLPRVVMPNRDGFVNAYPVRPARYDYPNER